jgi:putative transposase
MSKNSASPSSVCEVPLQISPAQEKILHTRLEMAHHHYNQCLAESKKRLHLMLQSKQYQELQSLPRCHKAQRTKAYQQLQKDFGFQEYDLHSFEKDIRNAYFQSHLDSHVGQKLASRAFSAVQKIWLKKAKRVRFKGKYQLSSVEGKSLKSPLTWKANQVVWKGLKLKTRLDKNDRWLVESLKQEVKYVRLVRRCLNGKWRFYAQLVLEGNPVKKEKKKGEVQLCGRVGLDVGPSTVAIVAESGVAQLKPFCPELKPKVQEKRVLQRKLERQRRANNPENYEKDGRIKRGKKKWKDSKRYLETRKQIANEERKLAEQRKTSHGALLNFIMLLGTIFCFEKLSYKGWQKGWFGKSVNRNAPGQFIARLKHKAGSASAEIVEIDPRENKLSQRCHCGRMKKKRLSERVHECECGVYAQRDLYSAYLARFVSKDNKLHADQACESWSSADSLLQTAWEKAYETASVSQVRNSFGNPDFQRKSSSSAEERIERTKAWNVVASDFQSDGESPRQLLLFRS